MFPGRLPTLPELSHFSGSQSTPLFVEIGGGSGGFGGGFPGGINIGAVPIGGGNPASGGGSGRTISSIPSIPSSPIGIGTSMLSNLLGIPAINWGRIAAFLLGLILIAGGIYLIRPVNQIVNQSVKNSVKGALAA